MDAEVESLLGFPTTSDRAERLSDLLAEFEVCSSTLTEMENKPPKAALQFGGLFSIFGFLYVPKLKLMHKAYKGSAEFGQLWNSKKWLSQPQGVFAVEEEFQIRRLLCRFWWNFNCTNRRKRCHAQPVGNATSTSKEFRTPMINISRKVGSRLQAETTSQNPHHTMHSNQVFRFSRMDQVALSEVMFTLFAMEQPT